MLFWMSELAWKLCFVLNFNLWLSISGNKETWDCSYTSVVVGNIFVEVWVLLLNMFAGCDDLIVLNKEMPRWTFGFEAPSFFRPQFMLPHVPSTIWKWSAFAFSRVSSTSRIEGVSTQLSWRQSPWLKQIKSSGCVLGSGALGDSKGEVCIGNVIAEM